jgi:hypothetical protein
VVVAVLLVVVGPVVDTVVCAPDDWWGYNPKHVEQIPDKINCVNLQLVGYTYIGIYLGYTDQ